MDSVLRTLEEHDAERLLVFTNRRVGLRAFLVLDDLRLGPGAGGTRTMAYPSAAAALTDALGLARTMTLKCSIAGLDAGGAKLVVIDHPNLDRAAAFDILGSRIDELGGIFITAGDLGTTGDDLSRMAARTPYVRTDEPELAAAVGLGLRYCAEALAQFTNRDSLSGLRVAVQGCGAIGSAVATALADAGVELYVADIDDAAAAALAGRLGARVLAAEEVLRADVDLVAPCAIGAAITDELVADIRAWAVCGAANNVLANPRVGDRLAERGILLVPDMIASAGAVIRGICAMQQRNDELELISRLGDTTRRVLESAAATQRSTTAIATRMARERLEAAS